MISPIVFLDIDGVLQMAQDPPGRFKPEAIAALNWLTEAAQAQIVVSSAWRIMPTVPQILRGNGVRAPIIGKTPIFDGSHRLAATLPAPTRGHEIAAWLRSRPRRHPFVILDDNADMDHLLPYLVQTAPQVGLTAEDAKRALAVLARAPATDRPG